MTFAIGADIDKTTQHSVANLFQVRSHLKYSCCHSNVSIMYADRVRQVECPVSRTARLDTGKG